jgi:hypothetical protein
MTTLTIEIKYMDVKDEIQNGQINIELYVKNHHVPSFPDVLNALNGKTGEYKWMDLVAYARIVDVLLVFITHHLLPKEHVRMLREYLV